MPLGSAFERIGSALPRRTRKEFVMAVVYRRSSNASLDFSLHSAGLLDRMMAQGTIMLRIFALLFLSSALHCLEEG